MGKNNPHDSFFRGIFGEPGDAAGLLQAALPAAALQHLDLGSLRAIPGGLGDARLSWRYTDLLFEAKLAGQEVLLFVVIEHQSEPDPLMPVRVLAYIVRKWEQWTERHPNATSVPAVLAVVVSHAPKGWSEPTRLRQTIALPPGVMADVAPLLPELRLAVDDLVRRPDRELRGRPLSPLGRLALLLLKHGRSKGLLRRMRRWGALLSAVWQTHGSAAAERIASYTLAVGDMSPEELGELMAQSGGGEQAKEAVMSTAERLQREGERRGERRGQRKGRAEVLLRLLRIRFGDLDEATEQRIRSASVATLDRWAERVLAAQSIDEVLDDEEGLDDEALDDEALGDEALDDD